MPRARTSVEPIRRPALTQGGPEPGGRDRLLLDIASLLLQHPDMTLRVAWPAGVVVITLGLAQAAAGSAAAQTSERIQAEERARRATDRIRSLQRDAEALATEERSLLIELRQLEVERRIRAEELARGDAELIVVVQRLDETRQRVAYLEGRVEEQRGDVEGRLVELYKLGRAGYLRMLLSVEDLRAVGRAYRTVAALQHLDRERVVTHRGTLDALRDERAALEARAAEIEALQHEARVARDDLDRAVRAREALVRSIDAHRDLYAQLAGELTVAQQRLQASLATLAAGGIVDGSAIALPIRPFRGALDWPVDGPVAGRFDPSGSRGTGGSVARNGIEIAADEGTPVHAVHEGRVAFAGPFTGFGNLVILEHGDGDFSLYGHLDVTIVQTDTRIDRGARVGSVGVGPTGGPGLYFELRIDGSPVDPIQWLRRP